MEKIIGRLTIQARDPKFAARFHQNPCHHGHPCVMLTAASAFRARDFHVIFNFFYCQFFRLLPLQLGTFILEITPMSGAPRNGLSRKSKSIENETS